MSVVLYYHPFSRASGTIWALEEVGVPYELRFVDILKGEQKSPQLLELNPMGKIPTLTDGDVVVAESAAIALYLADRYAYGKLAPKLDDPKRGTYLRWSFFAPAVIEPGAMAKMNQWPFKDGNAGWGSYEAMLASMENALSHGPYLLGEEFSMADVVFGGTMRYMLMFKMLDPRPAFTAYVERISERPAAKRADAKNAEEREKHGLNK